MAASGSARPGRVWLITGATSGFGRALTEAALAAGDTVVGAARSPDRSAIARPKSPRLASESVAEVTAA